MNRLCLIISFVGIYSILIGQYSFVAIGDMGETDDGISLTWTLGEFVTGSTNFSNGLFLTQGMQQPITVEQITAVDAPVVGYELNQNEPNPFKNQTLISFIAPNHSDVKIHIYNAMGILVYSKNSFGSSGKQRILINSEELVGRGTYYIQLIADKFMSTKKMILVD